MTKDEINTSLFDEVKQQRDEIERLTREVDIQKSLWAEAESELEAANKKIAELEAAIDKIIESASDAALIRVQAIELAAQEKP